MYIDMYICMCVYVYIIHTRCVHHPTHFEAAACERDNSTTIQHIINQQILPTEVTATSAPRARSRSRRPASERYCHYHYHHHYYHYCY